MGSLDSVCASRSAQPFSLDERYIRVANLCTLDLCVAFDHCRDDPVILQLRGLNDCADGCSSLSVTVSGSSLELADLFVRYGLLAWFSLEMNASDDFLAKIAAFVKINATELIHREFLR